MKFFLMTSHLDSHGTTDVKPEMLSGVRTVHSAPHDKYNICGIAHARTKRNDDILCKDDYIYIGVGARDLYIDKAHTALDIFHFAAFFFSNKLLLKI